MSYKEAIIIPLDVFKKCNFSKEDMSQSDTENKLSTPTDILQNKTLPSDVKIKLYKQKKKLQKKREPEPQVVTVKSSTPDKAKPSENIILNEFPMATRPLVYMIMKYMKESTGILSWNNNLELVNEGTAIQDSNIIDLLKFVTNSLTITSNKDVPVGATEFVKGLEKIGVPKAYIKLPRRSARVAGWINI